jgi:glucose-6-phosphate isomerase
MSPLLRVEPGDAGAPAPSPERDGIAAELLAAQRALEARACPGAEYLGWLDLPSAAASGLPAMLEVAAEARERCDAFVVVGIGGSYLGARAVIEACAPVFGRSGPEILYAGHHLSGAALRALLRHLEGRVVMVNVISKSGTTTEPALAFRVLQRWMVERYGAEGAAGRIIATTDAARGALRGLAEAAGYRRFVIPDDVGGRFSVLTPVGLLPVAVAGIDAQALCAGADAMRAATRATSMDANPALAYAAWRMLQHRRGKTVEVLAAFQPELAFVTEWWKQLFGESEGKEGRGLFPAAVVNTTDLHSMGQYIQDGARLLFETFLAVDALPDDVTIPDLPGDDDGLNYLAGRRFADINAEALRGTALAHRSGGVPTATLRLPSLAPEHVGQLLYCFEYAVALSGIALGVNPFDQPGVEEYKRNMFALLGKPGYEQLRRDLDAR